MSLRTSAAWTFAGNAVYAAAQWGMVAGLARMGTPADVGLITLALALTAPVFLLMGLQLRSVQATDARQQHPFSSYLRLRLLGMALALVSCGVLSVVYPEATGALLWLGLAKTFEGISDVLYGLMQRSERLDWVSGATLLRGLFGLGFLLVGYRLTHNVAAAAAGLAIANGLVLLLLDWPRARKLGADARAQLTGPALRSLLRVSWPLGLVMGLISLGAALPRLFVEHMMGQANLGLYGALVYIPLAGSVVVNALGTVLTVRLSRAYASGNVRGFLKLALQFGVITAGLGTGLILVAVVAGQPLLRLVYGPVYAHEQASFVWLAVSGAVGYVAAASGFATTAARRFFEQLPLFVVVTAVLALSGWLLVPRLGLTGAALSALIGSLVQLVGSVLIVAHALRQPVRADALEKPAT